MSNQVGIAELGGLFVLFIILRSSNTLSSAGFCPDGWVPSNASGTCIKLFNTEVPWEEARTNCQKDGADLIVILNEDMDLFVFDLISRNECSIYYIGLNSGKGGQFFWLDSQDKVNYTRWSRGQPYVPLGTKYCTTVYTKFNHSTAWLPIECKSEMCYICEKLSVACGKTTFGPNCRQHCSQNCAGVDKSCDYRNGTCIQGCVIGYKEPRCNQACGNNTFGQSCTQHCSRNCAGPDKSCDHRNGACIQGCVIGYKEPRCDKACGNNTFGQNCAQDCSRNCAGPDKSCDYRNGACIQGCVVGYKEPRCNEACGNNTFGQNCAQDCSRNCAGPDKSCDHRNGACIQGCVVGFKEPKCIEACDPGRFGQNCSQQCTSNCAGTCMATNGWCIDGCQDGFTGAYCESRSDDILNLSQQTMSISLLIAVAVCMGLILLCYFIPAGHTKRKASDNLNFQHGHDDALSETTAAKPLRVNYEKENNATKTNAIDSNVSIAQLSSMGSMSYSESSISERSSTY